jgi:hypothetical protein
MNFPFEHEQPIAGGWLAYCACARGVQNEDHSVRDTGEDKKVILAEGRRIADRD